LFVTGKNVLDTDMSFDFDGGDAGFGEFGSGESRDADGPVGGKGS
jgi:hypothetical protein